MPDLERLTTVEPELRPIQLEGDSQAIGTAVVGWLGAGLTVRVVRGGKMKTLDGLFGEFAAAFQFPSYFGENPDAFDECIADLESLPADLGYVVVVTEPDLVLVDEPRWFAWFADSLASATKRWGMSIELGEWWDRPAVPFHVVLAGEGSVVRAAARRWS